WTRMLHAIISGTASVGDSTCSRIAPAIAEKAKPAKPETVAPAKTASVKGRKCENSIIVAPLEDFRLPGRPGGALGRWPTRIRQWETPRDVPWIDETLNACAAQAT